MNKHDHSPTSYIPGRVALALSVTLLLIAALPNGTPSQYRLQVGLCDPAAGDRLPALTAGRLLLYSPKCRICDDG